MLCVWNAEGYKANDGFEWHCGCMNDLCLSIDLEQDAELS